jgi:hypothetical protein
MNEIKPLRKEKKKLLFFIRAGISNKYVAYNI